MKIDLKERIGDGSFADVWLGQDELERFVAVKIIREASVNVSNALNHARALARTNHENVVKVYSLEKVNDPEQNEEVDGVVMEYLEGETLEKHLANNVIAELELRRIGLGIINGIAHIHEQGLSHGDLHVANVMVDSCNVKVIDILYLNSLAVASSETREKKLNRDLMSLRLILQELIHNSNLIKAKAKKFNNELDYNATVEDIRQAFEAIFNQQSTSKKEEHSSRVDELYGLIIEENFVSGDNYARALASETDDSIVKEILEKLIDNGSFDYKHQDYVRILWHRLNDAERVEVLANVSVKLDREIPEGNWSPHIRMVQAFGVDNWNALPIRIRIRVEGCITKDILAGYKDIYAWQSISGGSLGTYATVFGELFDDKVKLSENLISMLRQNWYTQNYVAHCFMSYLFPIMKATNMESECIEAIKIALNNGAAIVRQKIDLLPESWRTVLKE